MFNIEVRRQIQQIERLLEDAEAATADDLELRAHWARYICVRAAGFVEVGLTEIYTDFARRIAPQPVANYAAAHLATIQNPKASKLIEISGRFKSTWREALTQFLDDQGRGDAIDSIMANRHLIAHGKTSGITLVRIKQYFELAVEVLEYIETQCRA